MRVVLHVGAHKTGTSLIQKYFSDDPQRSEDLGIGLITRADASVLVGWGHRPPDDLRARLDEEMARRPSVVMMSLENMLGRPLKPGKPGLYPDASRGAQNLAKACDGFDTYVVYYVRPIADFLESYHLQTIQQGAWHSFEDWYGSLEGSLNWKPAVQALEDAFGADRVILGDFAEISAGQNQFLRNFMTRAGLPQAPTIDYKPIRNASISARGLEIALRINPYLHTDQERRATRLFLQKHFSNQVEDRARPMPEEIRRSITDETAAEFEDLAARAAAALASPPVPAPAPRPLDAASPKRTMTAQRRLVNRIRARARR